MVLFDYLCADTYTQVSIFSCSLFPLIWYPSTYTKAKESGLVMKSLITISGFISQTERESLVDEEKCLLFKGEFLMIT